MQAPPPPIRCYFLCLLPASLRFWPASLRFLRQVPSWFRERGCLPPPSSRTYGPFPARRSATVGTSVPELDSSHLAAVLLRC
jgi:hypothetical protein